PGLYPSTVTIADAEARTRIRNVATSHTGDLATSKATFSADGGDTVTCTCINTKGAAVIVKKVMVGGTGTFTYSGTPSGAISTNNGTITASVAPGQYTSTETVPAGWALTSISCDDTNSTGNVGTATATFNAEAGETVTCTFTNTGVTSADLSVTKSDGVTTVTAGDGVTRTYTITVSNAGPSNATGVTLTDAWPSGFARGTPSPSQGTCTNVGLGPNFTCALGTLAQGGSATVTVNYTVPASTLAGPQTNTVIVSSDTPDSVPGNNT